MSHVGQCLRLNQPCYGLVPDRDYFYVGRPDNFSFVTLCFFSLDPLNVYLERLSAAEFENGIEENAIVPVDSSPYPPWIAPFVSQGSDANSTTMSLQQFLEKNKGLVEDRYAKIEPLVVRAQEIVNARDPFQEINGHAKKHKPELNQARTRLHFFSYVCFGFNSTALLPNTWKNGRHERGPANEDLERIREGCIAGYKTHSRIGKTYSTIFEDTLRSEFKCRTRLVNGKDEIYQPDGNRRPTLAEFMRIVKAHYGQAYLDKRRYGQNRARNKKRQQQGKFTEHCVNLLERLEGDAYYVRSVQKGVLADEMPPMCIARLIDTLSGSRVGVGGSLNGEKATAYAMAFFCMGLPKQLFCSYFGIDLDPSRWPSYGLPLTYILDRGPGTKASLLEEILEFVPHVELALSGSGQSKAISESTHPRSTKIDGLPVYDISDMNYIEHFKREIYTTFDGNWRSDVRGRLTKELIENGVAPRPIHLWNYFDSRMRSDAIRVPVDELIRRFLRKTTCLIKRSGAWIESTLCFRSQALFESGLCERIVGNQSFKVKAYVLDLCLRHIWIEHDGRLIEAHLVPALAGDADDIDWTILDVRRNVELRQQLEREAREQDLAVGLALAEDFERQTGLAMNGGRQQARRPRRRTPEAMDELAVLHSMFGAKR